MKIKNLLSKVKHLRKEVLILIVTVLIIFIIGVGILILPNIGIEEEYSAVEKFSIYEETYTQTIPAIEAKEAVYSEPKDYSVFVGDEDIDDNNDGKPDHSGQYVGIDIEPGSYLIEKLELDEYCSLKLKYASDDNMFGGDQYYEGDEVYLSSGQKLAAFNCGSHNGGLKVTLKSLDEPTLISEAVEGKEEEVITADVSYYSDEKITCTVKGYINEEGNYTAQDCIGSDYAEKIKSEIDENKIQPIETRTEKVVIKGEQTTCYLNNKEANCMDLIKDSALELEARRARIEAEK